MQAQPMAGRVVVITGGTSGIGQATATALARQGASVIIVGRGLARTAVTAIKAASGNDTVASLLADLASLTSVRQLAAHIIREYPRLHVLINNAGVIYTKRTTTVDGYETTFAVNCLAPFLLTTLLLDTLKASSPARIINVTSNAQARAVMHFDDLQSERRYSPFRAYGQSALARILFTHALARRLDGTGVTANALHPGAVATNLGTSNGGLLVALYKLARPLLKTPEQGAQTSIYLAAAPDVANTSGKYFINCKETRSSTASYSDTDAEKLWTISEKLTALP